MDEQNENNEEQVPEKQDTGFGLDFSMNDVFDSSVLEFESTI